MTPRKISTRALLVASAAALLLTGPAATQNPQSGPVARYDMRAGTVSGFMAMAAGGEKPGIGGALSMMMGGGGSARELELRLGSQQLPTKGKAKADHFMPAGAKLGKSVPLFTPEPGKPGPVGEDKPPEEREFKKPKGRLLIYWGCGAKAAKGQPVVIDFAKMAAGQVPPNLFASSVIRDYGPQMSNSKTYGYWPGPDGKRLKGDSSLLGAHRITGNYSPEIAFTLAQDFLDPLKAKAIDGTTGVPVSWNSVPRSTGYFLWAFGAKGTGANSSGPGDATDLVWWSSSASRDFFGGLTDWISPAEVTRLINRKAVLPPAITQCTIPAEVRRDAPDFLMGNLFAYGPEENFAYPPKPAEAKARWDLQWTARVRHRSTTSFMVGGPDMGAMGSADKPEDKPKCKKGLGGLLGGAIGAC